MIEFDECLVEITPAPAFRRVVTFDDRMPGSLKMPGGVFAGGLVATANMPA
jgi:hypothetical protein